MKLLKHVLLALCCLLLMISCEYEFIEVATPTPPDPGDTTGVDTISFAGQIEPVFASSNCTNCHNGSITLDLSAGNAYQSIQVNGVVIPGDPENSVLYTYPNPVTGTHTSKYATTDEADLIYLWILQGALDN